MQTIRRELQFTVDEDSGLTVVKVFNKETDELIRQIPSEDFLKLAKTKSREKNFGLGEKQLSLLVVIWPQIIIVWMALFQEVD